MMKKITALLASGFFFLSFSSANAEYNVGFSLMAGETDTSGHELENGAAADKNTKDIQEVFMGGSIFAEFVADNGFTFGIDYVPLDVELGSGKRTDASGTTGRDSGTRSASAELSDLITYYINVPFGANGFYGSFGYHTVDVTTNETLPTASYGDATIDGFQYGLGFKSGQLRYELFYSDFDDVSLTATGGKGSHKVEADADALGLKVGFAF